MQGLLFLVTHRLLTIVLLGMLLDKHCHPSGFSNLNLYHKYKMIKLNLHCKIYIIFFNAVY